MSCLSGATMRMMKGAEAHLAGWIAAAALGFTAACGGAVADGNGPSGQTLGSSTGGAANAGDSGAAASAGGAGAAGSAAATGGATTPVEAAAGGAATGTGGASSGGNDVTTGGVGQGGVGGREIDASHLGNIGGSAFMIADLCDQCGLSRMSDPCRDLIYAIPTFDVPAYQPCWDIGFAFAECITTKRASFCSAPSESGCEAERAALDACW